MIKKIVNGGVNRHKRELKDKIILEEDIDKIYQIKKELADEEFKKLVYDNDKIDLFKYLKNNDKISSLLQEKELCFLE